MSPHTRARAAPPLLGVLGGMGPAATADFLRRLVALTPATRDQDHLPVLVSSVPQIPDRTAAFLGRGESPLQALVAEGRRLVAAGATLVVMPCNTAHLWFEPLQAALGVPMLHIVDAALACLPPADDGEGALRRVGLLATEATLRAGLYVERGALAARRAGEAGRTEHKPLLWHLPSEREIAEWVTPGIAAVKAGELAIGRRCLRQAAQALVARGARRIVLGCTEIPLVLEAADAGVPLVDATEALARCTVAWSRARLI